MTDTTSEQTYGSDGLGGWEAVGIPTVEAQAWARAGYRPNEATDWRAAGALDPGTAAEWERYGFTPSAAEEWLAVGEVGPCRRDHDERGGGDAGAVCPHPGAGSALRGCRDRRARPDPIVGRTAADRVLNHTGRACRTPASTQVTAHLGAGHLDQGVSR